MRGRSWSLAWQKGLKEKLGCFGLTLIEEQSITMDDRSLNPQANMDTLIHEILHACYSSTSLPHVVGQDEKEQGELEETIVDSIAPAILSLIVDNPELIAKIQEEYDRGRIE